jgi:hypothetical protein
MRRAIDAKRGGWQATEAAWVASVAALVVLGQATLVGAQEECDLSPPGACTRTSEAALRACHAEARDDYWIAVGRCRNLGRDERSECLTEAATSREEALAECVDQCEARQDVCDLVGQRRYDPDFGPASFVNPDDIGDTVEPNPYFPLVPGTRWVWAGGGQTVTDTVTDKVKLIEGVTCRVVHDVVEEDGAVIEITDDWFAQDLQGNVWYCGEIPQNFELFDGDDPEEPELVDIDGAWKVGREGGAPGIIALADPRVGDAYREEVALGEAEDVAEVASITGNESVPAAQCQNDCVVTRNFTALEPGVNEFKHYKPGIGLILEVDSEGTRIELIELSTP